MMLQKKLFKINNKHDSLQSRKHINILMKNTDDLFGMVWYGILEFNVPFDTV